MDFHQMIYNMSDAAVYRKHKLRIAELANWLWHQSNIYSLMGLDQHFFYYLVWDFLVVYFRGWYPQGYLSMGVLYTHGHFV